MIREKEIALQQLQNNDYNFFRWAESLWYDPEVCLAAVKQDGYALKYVKEQTPEICMAAVQENGWALRYVKEQTPEICMEAVKQDVGALIWVKEQSPDILRTVLENMTTRNAELTMRGISPKNAVEIAKVYLEHLRKEDEKKM